MRVIVEEPRAVVLLSGGLDSATVLAIARADGFVPYALTFDYGQRHAIEIDAARRIAASAGVARHLVLPIDLRAFGGSALTADVPVPKDRAADAMSHGIPSTYVPARNTIFLSLALAWSEVLGAHDLFIRALGRAGDESRRPRRALPHPCPALAAKQGGDHPPRPGAGCRLFADDFLL
jgi:7-cyano-7-deazaguanine synthase